MNHLLLTIHFLDSRYHGLLTKNGPPEWPPSPYRVFQALLSGVARRGELVMGVDTPSNRRWTTIGNALNWLQEYTSQNPPIIVTPQRKPYREGSGIVKFVLNNDDEAHRYPELHRVAKPTIPTLFLLDKDQKPEVHYVWELDDQNDCPITDIERAAHSLTALGWGIDMAFADARLANETELQKLKGIRWYPKKNAGSFEDTLRMPTVEYGQEGKIVESTLDDLCHCHSTFINRIEHGKPLKTVDKPKVFDRVLYTSVERPCGRPRFVFRLVDENGDTVSYPQAKLIQIAGMVRHLARDRMKDHPPRDLRGRSLEQWLREYVMGHQLPEDKDAGRPHTQFSYVPLPSIGHPYTDPAVRRVMIVAPVGDEAWLYHLARCLNGELLKPLSKTTLPPGTQLQLISENRKDGVRNAYTGKSRVWASFTPVILPGHNDHRPEKTQKLIEKALQQSGVEQPCEFEWSAISHFPKAFTAHKYVIDGSMKRPIGYIWPDHLLDKSTVHLVLRFGRREDPDDPNSHWIPDEHPIPGPITIGAGRHCGFGLFAACDET